MIISKDYIAGFFDGEGCVNCSAGRNGVPHVQLVLTGTHKPLLDMLCGEYGGNVYKKQRRLEHHTQAYSWQISKYERFAKDMLPWLIIKRDVVSEAIKFLGTIDKKRTRNGLKAGVIEERIRIMKRIKELNK